MPYYVVAEILLSKSSLIFALFKSSFLTNRCFNHWTFHRERSSEKYLEFQVNRYGGLVEYHKSKKACPLQNDEFQRFTNFKKPIDKLIKLVENKQRNVLKSFDSFIIKFSRRATYFHYQFKEVTAIHRSISLWRL